MTDENMIAADQRLIADMFGRVMVCLLTAEGAEWVYLSGQDFLTSLGALVKLAKPYEIRADGVGLKAWSWSRKLTRAEERKLAKRPHLRAA